MAVVLDLQGVRRRYRGAGEVLRGVDLRVRAGGASVVLGANGSGKSTLLRIAAGVTAPSAGRVTGRAPVVGYLPAPFPAPARGSVRGYLGHLAAMRGDARMGADRAEQLLERLGFTGAREGTVAELSTGNAQKVGLAQALCASPGLVVLDEPWTGLDDAAAAVLARCLADVARSVPVLIADHTGRAAGLRGARAHRLRDGVVEPVTTPAGCVTTGATSEIELWCPGTAVAVLADLPAVVSAEHDGRRLRVLVERSRCDAWVSAALARGCSLLSVRHHDGDEVGW